MKKLAAATAALVLALGALVGCNTIEGLGKDMSAAGRAVSGAANDNKPSEQKK
jgi:entericidin B